MTNFSFPLNFASRQLAYLQQFIGKLVLSIDFGFQSSIKNPCSRVGHFLRFSKSMKAQGQSNIILELEKKANFHDPDFKIFPRLKMIKDKFPGLFSQTMSSQIYSPTKINFNFVPGILKRKNLTPRKSTQAHLYLYPETLDGGYSLENNRPIVDSGLKITQMLCFPTLVKAAKNSPQTKNLSYQIARTDHHSLDKKHPDGVSNKHFQVVGQKCGQKDCGTKLCQDTCDEKVQNKALAVVTSNFEKDLKHKYLENTGIKMIRPDGQLATVKNFNKPWDKCPDAVNIEELPNSQDLLDQNDNRQKIHAIIEKLNQKKNG